VSVGIAELVVDELLKFIEAVPMEGDSAVLEYDRAAMVVRVKTLFAERRRKKSVAMTARNFFIRDTAARFAQPHSLPSAGLAHDLVYPDPDACILQAVALADKLAEQGFFE
jgi:hypothetical protein